MQRIWHYLKELFKISWPYWAHGDLVGTLIQAATAALAALLVWMGFAGTPLASHAKEIGFCAFVVFFFFGAAPFRLWLAQTARIEGFEQAAVPRLHITEFDHTEPKGAPGLAEREWRLKLTNTSTTAIKGCYVAKKSMINVLGNESESAGQRFKLCSEQPISIQAYVHTQAFDLAPGGEQYVSIAGTHERDPDANVIMLYAAKGAAAGAVRNSIPRRFFPHTLVLQVCAENLPVPVELAFKVHFYNGRFKMDKLPGTAPSEKGGIESAAG